MRPEFISNEDIMRWSESIDNDPYFSKELAESPIIRETCYAGLWLAEELQKLLCPDEIILRIQYTAGKCSFGRNPWEIHQDFLIKFKNDTLIFEDDDSIILN